MSTPRSVWLFIVWCWFDRHFYDEQARYARGMAVLPLLAVSVVLALVSSASMGWSYYSAVSDPQVSTMIDSMPEVYIRDGVVSSTAEQPLVWEVEENGERMMMVLDTTGQTTDFPPGVSRGLLLLRTEAHVLRDRRHDIHDLSEMDDLDINAEAVWSWISAIGFVGIPLLGALQACWTLAVRLIIAMVVGALIMALGSNNGVGWTGGVRVAMYGMFPTMITFGLLSLTGIFSGFWAGWWFLSLMLSAPFWILGVMSIGSSEGHGGPGRSAGSALDDHAFVAPRES